MSVYSQGSEGSVGAPDFDGETTGNGLATADPKTQSGLNITGIILSALGIIFSIIALVLLTEVLNETAPCQSERKKGLAITLIIGFSLILAISVAYLIYVGISSIPQRYKDNLLDAARQITPKSVKNFMNNF